MSTYSIRSAAGALALALAVAGPAVPVGAEIGDLAADSALGQSGFTDRQALPIDAATFALPKGVAVDRSVTPNRLYVSDSAHHRVLGWRDADALQNGAPADLVIGQADFGSWGCNGAPPSSGATPAATMSSLCDPRGLAVDGAGNLYVADAGNYRVLVFRDPFGTDVVADAVLGGTPGVGATKLGGPAAVALDSAGNAFVADSLNCRVLEYDAPLAGDVLPDRVFGQPDFTTRDCRAVYFPTGVAVDGAARLWVATASTVVEFDDALGASRVAPSYALGTAGCNDGGESASTTCGTLDVAVDGAGRLYVADSGNNRVLEYDTPRTVPQAARVFGQPDFGGASDLFHDACNLGGAGAASLCLRKVILLTLGGTYEEAGALALDGAGRLWVADGLNHRVLRYDAPLASDARADRVLGHVTMSDVRKPTFPLDQPQGALLSRSDYVVLALETLASRILVYPNFGDGVDVPVGVIGQPDFASTGCNSGGLDAAALCRPTAAVQDPSGNLWIADTGNNRVLEYLYPWVQYDYTNKAWVTKARADRVFGQPDFGASACAAGAAGLCGPRGVAVDGAGSLYVSDSGNNRIIHHQNPLADAIADRVYGQADFSGTACNAGGVGPDSLCDPRGLAVDANGDLYVADHGNNRVVVYQSVLANGGGADRVFGQSGNPGTATPGGGAAGLRGPVGIAFDRVGNLYVVDQDNDRVLEYDVPLTDTNADRAFGQPDLTSVGCNTGGVSASSLCSPSDVSVIEAYGERIVVADAGNDRVVRYDSPFCLGDFQLTPTLHFVKTLRSKPVSTKVQVKHGQLPGTDQLLFKGKDQLLETDGGIDDQEPLLTLWTDAGVVYQERVPHLSNVRLRGNTEVWDTEFLKGERDHGIDDFNLKDIWRPSPDGGFTPDRFTLTYKGRAVGLDLTGFAEPLAHFRLQWGSNCFTTELSCRPGNTGPLCKPAR